jgi:hypothetical protein
MTSGIQSGPWGAWEVPAERGDDGPSGGVAFGPAEVDSEADVPRWQVDLPADVELAEAQLKQAEEMLARSDKRLEEIPDRFDQLVSLAEKPRQVSFGIDSAGTAIGDPEVEALRLLGVLEPQAAVSFGLLDVPRETWDQARSQFQNAIDRILRLVAYYAWVETRTAGQLLARTMVGWSGDVDTLWELNLTEGQFSLHKRSLSLAIASRNTLIRTLVTATQGAVKLSALITTPGGAVLALPVAWKYVNQILSEVNKYRESAAG